MSSTFTWLFIVVVLVRYILWLFPGEYKEQIPAPVSMFHTDTHTGDGAMGQNKLVVSSAGWTLGGNLCGKGLLFTKHSELG